MLGTNLLAGGATDAVGGGTFAFGNLAIGFHTVGAEQLFVICLENGRNGNVHRATLFTVSAGGTTDNR